MKKLLAPFFTMVMHLVGCKSYDKMGRFDSETLTDEDIGKFERRDRSVKYRIRMLNSSKSTGI